MNTIDKQSFKITIPSIIAIILATVSIMSALYAYQSVSNSKFSEIKSNIQQLKSSQEIMQLEQNNGFKIINNSRMRDSADTVNSLRAIKEDLAEIKNLQLQSPYQRSYTAN